MTGTSKGMRELTEGHPIQRKLAGGKGAWGDLSQKNKELVTDEKSIKVPPSLCSELSLAASIHSNHLVCFLGGTTSPSPGSVLMCLEVELRSLPSALLLLADVGGAHWTSLQCLGTSSVGVGWWMEDSSWLHYPWSMSLTSAASCLPVPDYLPNDCRGSSSAGDLS